MDSGPLWFKAEKFLDPSFNPEAYVNDLKRFVSRHFSRSCTLHLTNPLQVPLEALESQLSQHAQALRNRLVEVVNQDYDEFVSLSTKLVDVDSAVAKLQVPLLEIKSRVEAARGVVAAQAVALQEGLARRQAAAAARALLELAQDAVHVMAKVEKLLAELPYSSTTSNTNHTANATTKKGDELQEQEDLEARIRLLDRLSSEVSRLHFFATRGEELAVVKLMAPRIESASSSLQSSLDTALATVLDAQNPTALAVLLHAYSSLGSNTSGAAASGAAEGVVRRRVIHPVVANCIAKESTTASTTTHESTPVVTLSTLLPAISVALKEQIGPFLEVALSTGGGGAAAFDFLGASVLPEVVSAVEASCPGCYSPGFPDAFHSNYTAAMAFVDGLEGYCVTVHQVERFRQSEAYVQFRKKWNTVAYFSLRFQDIASELEDVLASSQGVLPVSGSGKFMYAASNAVWKALQSCIDPIIFLPQLADRFLRLSLQILSRYASYVTSFSSPSSSSSSSSNGGETTRPQEPTNATEEGGGGGGEQQQEGTFTAPPATVAPQSPSTLALTVEALTAISQDITALQTAVRDEHMPQFIMIVSFVFTTTGSGGGGDNDRSAATAEAVRAAFDEADEALSAASSAVLRSAASGLVDRCCEALKQLRGIVATFRMTSRSAPTRPAQYASTILNPLASFVQQQAPAMSDSAKLALVRAVVEGVVQKYKSLAYDTLSTVRKTESSLRRLKSRREGTGAGGEGGGGGGGGGGGMGTDELIAMQLALDIEEFGKRIKDMVSSVGGVTGNDGEMGREVASWVAVVMAVVKSYDAVEGGGGGGIGVGTGGATGEEEE